MKLIEFDDTPKGVLRGILQDPKKDSSRGVIFVGGFERSGTAEIKFRDLASRLYDVGIPSLRFDFSGLGLSEREFTGSTIESWVYEFGKAYDSLQTNSGVSDIYVVAHSLGACIAGKFMEERPESIKGGVLIAPALNQRGLMRYWFVTGQNKKNPDVDVTWENYESLLSEEEFQEDCNQPNKPSKFNIIGPEYFIGSKESDFSGNYDGLENSFFHIHGDSDPAVPLPSVSVDFKERLIVAGGDHDIERQNKRGLWTGKAVDYIKNA